VVCVSFLRGAAVPLNLANRTKDLSAGYHANSIEKVFGMARSIVALIAKVR